MLVVVQVNEVRNVDRITFKNLKLAAELAGSPVRQLRRTSIYPEHLHKFCKPDRQVQRHAQS